MSGRSTAEIAADLRHIDDHDSVTSCQRLLSEAADRLAELDAEVARLAGGEVCEVCGSTDPTIRIIRTDNVGRRLFPDVPDVHEMACYWDEYHDPQKALVDLHAQSEYESDTHDALLPDCPTCGGKQLVDPRLSDDVGLKHCPDCTDGKVSIERLVAEHNALWDDDTFTSWYRYPPARDAIDHLRGVR